MKLAEYVAASTANPLGRRPWGYKLSAYDPRERYLSAYYRAHFAVPNPNEVGRRLDGFLSASFNRPGGLTQTKWASRDNYNAPLPVYGAPELLPRHYGSRLGILPNYYPPRPLPIGPIYADPWLLQQSSPQPVLQASPAVQTTLPQPVLTPATAAASGVPGTAVSSSGGPMANPSPAVTTPASSGSALTDLYNKAVAYLESSTWIPGVPNYMLAAAGVAAILVFAPRGGRRR